MVAASIVLVALPWLREGTDMVVLTIAMDEKSDLENTAGSAVFKSRTGIRRLKI